MQTRTWQEGNQYVLHDAEAMPQPSAALFEPSHWRGKRQLVGSAVGRASVSFISGGADGRTWALRHYQRGGLLRSLLSDRYWWTGLDQTRPWREFRLTESLYAHGLPVPKPVAARVERSGLAYRGDLITVFVENSEPLADVLAARPLPASEWSGIGALIRRFHKVGVRHDDINARNILCRADGGFILIDFDKAAVVPPGAWEARTLARLRRSLHKFRAAIPGFQFRDEDWGAVVAGYGA